MLCDDMRGPSGRRDIYQPKVRFSRPPARATRMDARIDARIDAGPFAEPRLDQGRQRADRRGGVRSLGGDLDLRAPGRTEHEQTHDGQGGNRGSLDGDGDPCDEAARELGELSGGARVQAALVYDRGMAAGAFRHLFGSTSWCEATLMYLRDRKSVVLGTNVYVSVAIGGRGTITNQTHTSSSPTSNFNRIT